MPTRLTADTMRPMPQKRLTADQRAYLAVLTRSYVQANAAVQAEVTAMRRYADPAEKALCDYLLDGTGTR